MTCFGLCGDSLGKSGLYKSSSNQRHIHRLLLALLTVLIVVAVVLFVTLYASSSFTQVNFLGKHTSSQPLGVYQHAAVSTDGPGCAKYGRQMLERNGTAMDALISVLLCMGVVIPESLGLGGGLFIVYYKRDENQAWVIDGRETAPAAATADMFAADPKSASKGPLSMGVPGELAAYWEAHKKFGSLSWDQLFEGAIDIASNGFPIHEHLYTAYLKNQLVHNSTLLKKLFTNPATGKFYEINEIMKRPDLVPTFETLAKNGVDEFYRGAMAKTLVNEIREAGGIITEQDFANYKANVYQAVNISLSNGMKLYSNDLPGSGPLLGFMLNTFLELGIKRNVGQSLEDSVTYYHRFVEIFKHAYAQRTRLEDRSFNRIEPQLKRLLSPEFVKTVAARINDERTYPQTYYSSLVSLAKDQGTSHVSIVDKYGNAASASSTINAYFGGGVMSQSTGIIFNNEMDDFSSPNITNQYGLPPTEFNKIEPGKRPLSSMCPAVIVDESGEVRIAIGASGGAQITSSVALNIARNQFLGEDLKSTIDAPRIHHQFSPNVIKYESDFPKNILAELQDRGHKVEVITGRSSIVMAVARTADGKLTANSDYRKGGSIDGY